MSVRKTIIATVVLSASLLAMTSSYAGSAANTLPAGGQVTAGTLTISQSGNVMNINQSTQRAVINWDSFNVGKNATVNFNQPDSTASTLNRVNSASQSMINGAVNANGQVIFVNPNGVVFGKGAEINTGGLVATTMNIKDADYMAGKNIYSGGESGKVINKGTITANSINGYIALMAPEVKNQGVLIANITSSNTIALVSGTKVTLSFNGSQLTDITVDASAINSLISNKNAIQTQGGQIIIAANAASNLKASVINNTGTINSDTVSTVGGKVYLTAGTVNQNGTISANSIQSDGGNITISGDQINLKTASNTTATGATAGGQILIGKTSKNTAQSQLNASNVTVAQGALVDASATLKGNGGLIELWSTISSTVAGTFKANGGLSGGNGGAIDTSSAGVVTYGQGLLVDTTAPKGKTGNWLTDPLTIIIDNAAASLLSNALNTTNVTLDATASSCAGIGNCTMSSTPLIHFLSGTSVYSIADTALTLNAPGGTITMDGSIAVGQVYAVAQTINVNGSINTTGGSNGSIYLAGAIINILGNINSNGSSNNSSSSNLISANTITSNNRRNGITGVNANDIQSNSTITLNADDTTYTSNGGVINIIASGDINIGSSSFNSDTNNTTYISANGLSGGVINIISVDGNINNQGIVDALGKTITGGNITITAKNTNTFTGALISSDGYTQAGVIQIGVANSIGSGSTLAPPSINSQVATLLAAVNFTPSSSSPNSGNILSSNTSLDNTTVITANAASTDSSVTPQVVLDSQAGQIYIAGNTTLNTAATIQANADTGGLIILTSPAGTYQNTGYIQTNGGAGLGGTIAEAGLISTTLIGATVEANGTLGGGNIIIGRDFQASPLLGSATQAALLPSLSLVIAVPTSASTIIDANSSVTANSTIGGDGGSILTWGDALGAYGRFNVDGGTSSGSGGFIETSGTYLDVSGIRVSATSQSGQGVMGTWLLDPYDVTITSTATSGTSFPFSASSASTILNTDIQTALATASVTISTGVDTSTTVGSITVNAPITWSASTTLTLTANYNININAAITASRSSGAGVVLNYNQGNNGGTYNFGLSSTGFSGNITFGGTGNSFSTKNYNTSVSYTLISNPLSTGSTGFNSASTTLTGNYALINDYTAPNGSNFTTTLYTDWGANFEGLGHSIYNMAVGSSSARASNVQGTFATSLRYDGSIQNLGFNSAQVYVNFTANYSYGLFFGTSNSASSTLYIKNLYVGGSTVIDVSGGRFVGAVIGYVNSGTYYSSYLSNIYVDGVTLSKTVTVSYSAQATGGVFGISQGGGGFFSNIYLSNSTVNVSGNGSSQPVPVGGIIGFHQNSNDGHIDNVGVSDSTIRSTASNTYFVGGVVGVAWHEVKNSSVTNTTVSMSATNNTSTNYYPSVGGIIGAGGTYGVSPGSGSTVAVSYNNSFTGGTVVNQNAAGTSYNTYTGSLYGGWSWFYNNVYGASQLGNWEGNSYGNTATTVSRTISGVTYTSTSHSSTINGVYNGAAPTVDVYLTIVSNQVGTYGTASTLNYWFSTSASNYGTGYIATMLPSSLQGVQVFTAGESSVTPSAIGLSGSISINTPLTSSLAANSYSILLSPSSLTYSGANFISGDNVNVVISQAPLNLTISKVYDGTTAFTNANTYTLSGTRYNGDAMPTIASGSAATSSANAASYTSFASNGLTLSNTNYTLTGGTLEATINQAQAYVVIEASQSSTYGTTPTINYTFNTNSAGTGSTISATPAGLSGTATITNAPSSSSDVGTYSLTYASGLSSTNYAFNAATSSVPYTVNQAQAYVVIEAAQSSTYGATPTINYTFNTNSAGTGSTISATPAGLSGTATITNAPSSSSDAGTYSLTYASGLSSTNYAFNAAASSVPYTVNQAQAYVIVTAGQSSTYGATPTINYTFNTNSAGTGSTISATPAGLSGTATITNAPTSSSDAGTYSLTYASGLSSTNYAFNAAASSTSYTVSPAVLNLTISKTYDGTTAFTNANSYTLSGTRYNGDAMPTIASGSAATSSANAASYTSFASNGLTLSNTNYTLTGGTLEATINQAPLGIIVNGVYSGLTTITPATYTITGLVSVSGTTQTLVPTSVAVSDANVSSNGANYVTSILSKTGTATLSNYVINTSYNGTSGTTTTNAVTLTGAPLGISVTGTYNGLYTMTPSSVTPIGLVNSQTLTGLSSVTLSSKDVASNGTNYVISAEGVTGTANLANYVITPAYNNASTSTQNVVTLSAAPLGISLAASYSGSTVIAPSTLTVTGLVNGETLTGLTSATLNNANVSANGSNYVTAISGPIGTATLSNYSITTTYNASSGTAQNAATIDPAVLEVTAVNSQKFVTESDPTGYGGVVYSGWVAGQSTSVLNITGLTIARSTPTVNTAGSDYTLTPSGLSANGGNYTFNYRPGQFTIVPADTLAVVVANSATSYGTAPAYTITSAKYLDSSNSTIYTLSPSVSGSVVTMSDGAGGSVTFTLTPVSSTGISAITSGSGNYKVDSYTLSATNKTIVSNNFSNSIVLTGALTVSSLGVNLSDITVTGLSKTYDGTTNVSGLGLTASSTSFKSGDVVSVTGSGNFSDTNVGTGKAITITPALTGTDAANYYLTGSGTISTTGSISQLASVTYTGTSGGDWSNSANWAGGAIPTLSNVATVIIPTTKTVVYDTANLTSLTPTAAITANGTLSFNGPTATTFANNVSGTGSISQSGTGALTLTGSNTYSGGTNLASGSSLIAGSSTALGAGALTSAGGTFSTSGVTLSSLTVNGAVTLASDITSSGNQIYNGALTLGRSLTLEADNGYITFNNSVGHVGISYANYVAQHGANNIYNLTVLADTININADITTYGTQTYGSSLVTTNVVIGDNGTNGTTRTLISQDPAITVWGTINDSITNTHDLILKSVAYSTADIPTIDLKGDVGDVKPLKSLSVATGIQATAGSPEFADISETQYGGTISLLGDVTTLNNQEYTAQTITIGSNSLPRDYIFTSNEGEVIFNAGASNVAPTVALGSSFTKANYAASNLTNQSVGNSGVSSGEILSEINRFLSEIDRFGLAANDISIDYRQVGNGGGSMDLICIDYDGSGNCKFDN